MIQALQFLVPVALVLTLAAPAQAAAGGARRTAEIVALTGTGQVRPETTGDWDQARVQQELFAGYFVRTGDLSRMAILFNDETQVRLGQNSQLQIKGAAQPGQSAPTRLRLNSGRAWTQSKSAPRGLSMETPAAVAAIRGTDWEMTVDADGTSTLTVLSGEVEFSNDLGRLSVKPGEQAVAVVGRAPAKRVLLNARQRVQWVGAFTVDPLRHVTFLAYPPAEAAPVLAGDADRAPEVHLRRGDALIDLDRHEEARQEYLSVARGGTSPGAALGLAWIDLHAGDLAGAEARLAQAGGADPELLALVKASTLILAEQLKPAEQLLERAAQAGGLRQPAAWLILAEIAVYAGDLDRARSWLDDAEKAFPGDARVASLRARVELAADDALAGRAQVDRAIASSPMTVEPRLAAGELARFEGEAAGAEAAFALAVTRKPGDDRGWYGRGAVRSERERVAGARADLARALAINPDGPGYRGELATLETFVNRLDDAGEQFARALAAHPEDYVALTGLGLLQLKRGEAREALENFLRAGVIEPRYARAHTFAAVALYQLSRVDRALEELAKASELDPKDPLPHLFASLIRGDRFEPTAALDESREALRLMPYLKSLNQVAGDQKGAANLGAALAFFGLEEWAQHYAQESFSPYWGGSHLFLGDRYPDGFAKSSEFVQGYLTDPVAFGAGNRFQSLVPRPGTYATVELLGSWVDADKSALSGVLQPRGTLNGLSTSSFPIAYFIDGAAGWLRPSDQEVQIEGDAQNVTGAVGARPTYNLGLFLLGTHDRTAVDINSPSAGLTVPFEISSTRFDAGATFRFDPEWQAWVKAGGDAYDGSVENWPQEFQGGVMFADYTLEQGERDVLLRNTVSLGAHELTVGAEYGKLTTKHRLTATLPGATGEIGLNADFDDSSQEIYLSDRFRPGRRWLVQGDLRYQRHEHAFESLFFVEEAGFADNSSGEETLNEFNPSFGVVWQPREQVVLRAAYQRWTRPFSANTLSPVATAGIVLDDRFVNAGGTLQRAALRGEWEIDSRTFVAAGLDYKDIESWSSEGIPAAAPNLESINKLRNVQIYNLASDTFLEGTPSVGAGRVFSLSGALNLILARPWSVFARYTFSDGRNTTVGFDGNEIPYIASHVTAVGSTFILPLGVHLNGAAVYQTRRFNDEANTQELAAGWNAALTGYVESRDKRWALRAGVANLLADAWDTVYFMDARYRF